MENTKLLSKTNVRKKRRMLISKQMMRFIAENLVAALIIKIIYDLMIIQCLPTIYIEEITYGVYFDANKIVFGYLVFIIVSFVSLYFIRKKNNNVSTGLIILFDLYYVPISSAYYLNNTSFAFLLFASLFFVLMPIINYFLFNIGKPFIENKKRINKRLFIALCVVVSFMCIIYCYNYNGLSLSLDINSVYDARADFVGSTNAFTSILFHFGGQVVTVGALYGLIKKKPLLVGLCVFAQVCIFSIARQKSDLLILLIVVAIWILHIFKLFNFVKKHLSVMLCIAIVVTYLEYSTLGSTMLFGLFIRRIMYFPSLLSYYYYDYFSTNVFLLFSQDVFLINRLGIGVYDVPVITLINEAYFGGHVPSPNNGLFGEAVMHLGYMGVILFPFIIIGLSKLFTSSISVFPKEVQFLLVVQFFLTMMNIPITGGVFVVTYFLWIPFALLIVKRRRPVAKQATISRELQLN